MSDQTGHNETGHSEDAGHDEAGLRPLGADGPKLKQRLREEKGDDQGFDPGASMLGTDNEAGSMPDKDEMATARNAPPPK